MQRNHNKNKQTLNTTLTKIEESNIGVVITAALFMLVGTQLVQTGANYIDYYKQRKEIQQEKIIYQKEIKKAEKLGLPIQIGDYNGNNILDKYYELNGIKIPVEIDNKRYIEYF